MPKNNSCRPRHLLVIYKPHNPAEAKEMSHYIRDNLTPSAKDMIRATIAFIEAVKYGRPFCEVKQP